MSNVAAVVQRKMFPIRFSEEELARLDLVTKHYGLTAAGVLLLMLKREADAIAQAAPAPKRGSSRRSSRPPERPTPSLLGCSTARIRRDPEEREQGEGCPLTRGATFVTVSLANGKTEQWVMDRTGHKSSQMVSLYARQARTWSEPNLGALAPMHKLLPEMKDAGDTTSTSPTPSKPRQTGRRSEWATEGSCRTRRHPLRPGGDGDAARVLHPDKGPSGPSSLCWTRFELWSWLPRRPFDSFSSRSGGSGLQAER